MPSQASFMSKDQYVFLFGIVAVALLVLKFLLPLALYDVPLGYDTGLYRYLFAKHGAAFPPFVLGDIEPWAKGHPLGLFFFSTILLRLGLPVDALIGWVWNLFALVPLMTLAWVFGRREGQWIGVLILFASLLSIPYYDGFASMYWKNYLALLTMVLTVAALERRSYMAMIPGFLTVFVHHQTGLLLCLAVASWWFFTLYAERRGGGSWRAPVIVAVLVLLAGLIPYLHVFQQAILENAWLLLSRRGEGVSPGAFPDTVWYLRTYGISLLLGVLGFVLTVRRDHSFSLWHWSVFWAAAFVFLRLLFYRRFFLHLDFFLLPFIALGMFFVWNKCTTVPQRSSFLLVLFAQALIALTAFQMHAPFMSRSELNRIAALDQHLPDDAYVLTLENTSALWVRGLLLNHRTAGPGLLSLPWEIEKWDIVLYGMSEERKELLRTLRGPLYFLLTQAFYAYYGDHAAPFLEDPCIEHLPELPLARFVCTTQAPSY